MGDRSTRFLWPILAIPAMVWIALFFLVPLYVVLCVAFGAVDPIFRTPIPIWNPLEWQFGQVQEVWDRLFGPDNFYLPAVLRTLLYVAIAVVTCLIIAFPVAYFTARYAGKYKGLVLALLVAPFFISYLMRMLAWINLLQPDGLVNSIITLGGAIPLDITLHHHERRIMVRPQEAPERIGHGEDDRQRDQVDFGEVHAARGSMQPPSLSQTGFHRRKLCVAD